MRRAIAIVLGLAAATGLAGSAAVPAAQASPALASPAQASPAGAPRPGQPAGAAVATGAEHFRIISISSRARSSVLATGAFTAGGYQVSGRVTGLRATDTMVFPNGRLTVRRHITSQVLPLPTSACLVTEAIRGTLAAGAGTGAYRGVSAAGGFVQRITGVLPRSHGLCGGPMIVYQSITYEGATVRR
jgi:hypothetical protein